MHSIREVVSTAHAEPAPAPASWPAGRDGPAMAVMQAHMQAYRFALDPTPGQARQLRSHCGAARFAFNWGLGLVKQRLDQHASDPSVPVPWTLAAVRREWNQAKHEIAPWWRDNSKEAYSSGLDALGRALANFSASRA